MGELIGGAWSKIFDGQADNVERVEGASQAGEVASGP